MAENDVGTLAQAFLAAAAAGAAAFTEAATTTDPTDDAILSCLQCRVRWIAIVRCCGQET